MPSRSSLRISAIASFQTAPPKEPGCAVRKALAEGKIGQTRYSSYERLYELASQLKEWGAQMEKPGARTHNKPSGCGFVL